MKLKTSKKRTAAIGLGAILTFFVLTAESCGDEASGSTKEERKAGDEQLAQFLLAQPVPVFNYSQLRQNLIEIETAQANGTVTTSFFFNQGVPDPIHVCPSTGFAIPSTYQLTNPLKPSGYQDNATVAQLETTGVYTADTSGTYVICIDDKGEGYAFYWEGFVNTVAGPAKWNLTTHQVELTGKPTGGFTTEKDK